MNVEVIYRNDSERPLTDPLPELDRRRFIFRLVRGDYCDPMFGNWFRPPFPKVLLRHTFTWLALPFIAWRWPFTKRGGYIGAKVYGVDSPEYKNWLPADEVYDGSKAFCFSFRPFARLES